MIQSINLKEYCNKTKAQWILNNFDKIKIEEDRKDENFDSTMKLMKNYLNEVIKSKNGYLERKYISKRDGKGRLYLERKYGFQSMMREFRHTLCRDEYFDIDVSNCHPVLMVQYATKNNIKCECLKEYVENREKYFKYFEKCYQMDKTKTKNLIISLLYGAKLNEKFQDDKKIFKLYGEILKIHDKVYDLNKEIVTYVEKKKEKNIKGSVCSYLMQELENEILIPTVDFFKKRGYTVGALCFDGLMIQRNKEISNYLLLELKDHVKKFTCYEVDFLIKEMDQGFEIPDEELNQIEEIEQEKILNKDLVKQAKEEMKEEMAKEKAKAEYIIENDNEGAFYIIGKLGEKIKKSNGRIFFKIFEDSNIYKEDFSNNFQDTKDFLLNYILNMDIKKSVNNKIKIYSQDVSGASNLMKATFIKLEDDLSFCNKMWYSNLNKLCFKNGYYDFKSNTFKKYDNDTYSPIYINYDYIKADPAKKKEIFDLILDPIIPNKEQQEYLLNWFSRGLAGCYTDKTWAVGLGLRNSGKGVLTEAILKTVECYAGTFRADEMMNSDTGSGDIAKKYAWLMDFEYRRLNFSNELKEMDSKKRATVLDGNVIKSISSGGDNQEARKNFKNQVTFKIQGRMMLNLNNLVTCSPVDCNETLQIFTFKNEFKKESDFTERDHKINERGDRKILKADPNIKNLFLDESYKLALLEILIENYTEVQKEAPEITKNNKDDIVDKDDDISNRLENYIELTDCRKDKILISECNAILKKYFKLSQIKTGMMKLGVTETKTEGLRYYRYIKMKEIKEE